MSSAGRRTPSSVAPDDPDDPEHYIHDARGKMTAMSAIPGGLTWDEDGRGWMVALRLLSSGGPTVRVGTGAASRGVQLAGSSTWATARAIPTTPRRVPGPGRGTRRRRCLASFPPAP